MIVLDLLIKVAVFLYTFVGACLSVLMLFASSRDFSFGLKMEIWIFSFLPVVAYLWFKKSRAGKVEQNLRQLAGLAGGSGYLHAAWRSGIALNPATQKIALIEGGAKKVYDFSDVREWETTHVNAATTQVYSGNLGVQAAAAGQNIGSGMAAEANSGFFIGVRDIDHPKWRIEMSRKLHARWMEIMSQAINQN